MLLSLFWPTAPVWFHVVPWPKTHLTCIQYHDALTDLACLLLELVKVDLEVVKVKLETVDVELEVVKVELAVEWLVVVMLKGMARIPHRG